MHFKRTKGEYRETDRVTRFKLIKSGKHWLRAATSYFGLFRVLKGGVDKASVRVPQLEENAPSSVKEHLLKGLLTTGALLTGAATTYRVQADESNDASALERAVSPATDVFGGIRFSCFRSLKRAFAVTNRSNDQPLFQSQHQ